MDEAVKMRRFIHARSLCWFFQDGEWGDDMGVSDFLSTPVSEGVAEAISGVVEKLSRLWNKRIAHLTWVRVTDKQDKWPPEEALGPIREASLEFLRRVKDLDELTFRPKQDDVDEAIRILNGRDTPHCQNTTNTEVVVTRKVYPRAE